MQGSGPTACSVSRTSSCRRKSTRWSAAGRAVATQSTYALLDERVPPAAREIARRCARGADAPVFHEPRTGTDRRLRLVVRADDRRRSPRITADRSGIGSGGRRWEDLLVSPRAASARGDHKTAYLLGLYDEIDRLQGSQRRARSVPLDAHGARPVQRLCRREREGHRRLAPVRQSGSEW